MVNNKKTAKQKKGKEVPKKKNIVTAVSREATERVKSEVAGRQSLVRSNLRSQLESLIPNRLRWMVPFLENFRSDYEEPERLETGEEGFVGTVAPEETLPQTTHPVYRQYQCWSGDPLSCHFARETVEVNPKAAFCSECQFPVALAEKSEIRGNRGRYQINHFLHRRGMGRLYQATQLADGQPVVLKEYLLPTRSFFNEQERQQRKQAFLSLAGVNSVDGRLQDYRLVMPWEAIADHNLNRCYLVTQGKLDTHPTLASYLAKYGAMSEIQVRHVLNQVLQTLEFLHQQKVRLPSGQVRPGVAHGNLSLESLLIVGNLAEVAGVLPNGQGIEGRGQQGQEIGGSRQETGGRKQEAEAVQDGLQEEQTPAKPKTQNANTNFHIYACDLAMWEALFDLPLVMAQLPSPEKDLVDLGRVGFYLLAGKTHDPESGQLLDPTNSEVWQTVSPDLRGFLLRLMEVDRSFENAEISRQELLKLPVERSVGAIALEPEADTETVKSPPVLWWLLGLAGVALLGWLIWRFYPRSAPAIAQQNSQLCCINKVAGVPKGQFAYTVEAEGTWDYILTQRDLISKGTTLEQELATRQPKLQLFPRLELNSKAAISNVQSNRANPSAFAILSMTDDLVTYIAEKDLAQIEVAYDGLAVFVAFSYAKRDKSLPTQLKGQITLEQLQQLYTGRITNWKQLGGPDLQVQLYAPAEPEAIRIFEQRVLKTEQNIQQFRSLLPVVNSNNNSFIQLPGRIRRLPTLKMLRAVIQDFEDSDKGAIAFSNFSKVFGQCSVYPLAIATDATTSGVQALVQDKSNPIDPTTDLCRNKGSYQPKIDLFKTKQYPLAYPVSVVYPRDNSRPPVGEKFASILRTQEGQILLQQTGLVPLEEPRK